jgi:hypothetical protein
MADKQECPHCGAHNTRPLDLNQIKENIAENLPGGILKGAAVAAIKSMSKGAGAVAAVVVTADLWVRIFNTRKEHKGTVITCGSCKRKFEAA